MSLKELTQFAVYGQEKTTCRVSPGPLRHSGHVLVLTFWAEAQAVALRRKVISECCTSVKLPPMDLMIL